MTLVDPNICSLTKQQIGDRMLENIGRAKAEIDLEFL